MIEKVGQVTLNYKYYKGQDQYSDGDIEDELLQYVSSEQDIMQILKNESRWPILYHLSPVRQSIVEWYDFREDAEVLEVGAGCGAITGALCEKAGHVTCNDLSKRRSLINANRNRQYDNLEIMVGNFNDVKFEQQFDYISLIGVLEYARYYTDAEMPFTAFLQNMKPLLNKNGKILIAIENKYGLKYWAGAREDHSGEFFDGIEGYKNSKSEARTFAKEELEQIIRQAGYSQVKFYYPFPDYKFPTQIFSGDYLPKPEDILCSLESYDGSRMHLFNETATLAELVRLGKFEFFSNSFFVEVGE